MGLGHVELLRLDRTWGLLLLDHQLLGLLAGLLLLELDLDLPLTLRALCRLPEVQLQVLCLVLALKLAHLGILEGISGALEQVGIGLDVSNLLLARFLQLLQLGVQEHLVVGGLALHLTGAEGAHTDLARRGHGCLSIQSSGAASSLRRGSRIVLLLNVELARIVLDQLLVLWVAEHVAQLLLVLSGSLSSALHDSVREAVPILGHTYPPLQLLKACHVLGIRLQLILLLERLSLGAEALQGDLVAVEATDLLDVHLLAVGAAGSLYAADRLHGGELSDEARVLLGLRLLVLLLQDERSVLLLRLLGAIAAGLLDQVPWGQLQLASRLLRLHHGSLLVALGLTRILCICQVLLRNHASDALLLSLCTAQYHLLCGLGAEFGRDVLAHGVRVERLSLLLVLPKKVHPLVVLLNPVHVLEVCVLDGGLVAAHHCLRLLLHLLPIHYQVARLHLPVVAEALNLLNVVHVGELLLRPVAVVLQLAVLLLVQQVLELALLRHWLLLVKSWLALHCGLVLDLLLILIISDHLHVDAHLLLLVEELLEDHLGWLVLLAGGELLPASFLLLVHV